MFTQLKDAGKAVFYWDYDEFYMKENRQAVTHEAGEFIRRNLRDFPSPLSGELFKNLSKPKEVHYIASSTENAQARYLPQWIRNNLTTPEKETAVVLCNEALLQPVLHSLPAEVKHVNITMGFPLSQTPVYSFLIALLELHTHGFNFKSGRLHVSISCYTVKTPYTRQLTGQAELLEKELTRNNRFYPLPGELGKDEFLTRLFTPLPEPESVHTPVRNFAASGKHLPGKHFRYRGHRCIQPTLSGIAFQSLYHHQPVPHTDRRR